MFTTKQRVWLATLLALSVPGMARARAYLPTNLSNADIAVMQDAAKRISRAPHDAGRPEAWQNPQSGHSGTITFVRDVRKRGMSCERFNYVFRTGSPNDGNTYALTWCATPQGPWKIVN